MGTRASHLEPPRTDGIRHPTTRYLGGGRRLMRAYLAHAYDVHVHGAQRFPDSGPVLIVANHMGVLDGPVLVAYAPRQVHALVKAEMFAGWLGPVGHGLGQIPVSRQHVDPRAVKVGLRVLRDSGVLAVYPEGSRGAGDVAHSKLGAAYFALCTGAPILPVACLGTREPGASISRPASRGSRIDLVFGEPFGVGRLAWPRRKHVVCELAETVRQQLASHVQQACKLTGRRLPGAAPDEGRDADGRLGAEVGPDAVA